jgi:hypothetical protein
MRRTLSRRCQNVGTSEPMTCTLAPPPSSSIPLIASCHPSSSPGPESTTRTISPPQSCTFCTRCASRRGSKARRLAPWHVLQRVPHTKKPLRCVLGTYPNDTPTGLDQTSQVAGRRRVQSCGRREPQVWPQVYAEVPGSHAYGSRGPCTVLLPTPIC